MHVSLPTVSRVLHQHHICPVPQEQMNALQPPSDSNLARAQILLQAGGENLIDQCQGLLAVPQAILPAPKGPGLAEPPAADCLGWACAAAVRLSRAPACSAPFQEV